MRISRINLHHLNSIVQVPEAVQVEPLQPPLNKARHTMTRGVGRFSSFWYCGRKKKRNRPGSTGHLARCGPDKGEPCAQCNMIETPDCSGGLAQAQCVTWRLPLHHLSGEVEAMLKGAHLASLFKQRGLHCVMRGVPVPLVWGSIGGEGGHVSLTLRPESVWNTEGELIQGLLSLYQWSRVTPLLLARPRACSCVFLSSCLVVWLDSVWCWFNQAEAMLTSETEHRLLFFFKP